MKEYKVQIDKHGSEYWYNLTGEHHREGGPAITRKHSDGSIIAYGWYRDGKLHREDGPAIDGEDGKYWYINGLLHREDGPACEYGDGLKKHYIKGKWLSEEDFNKRKEKVCEKISGIKGVVLCGGLGTRLEPSTRILNKHLLPVYNKPMVYYPLETLKKAGITEVMVVVAGEHAGDFIKVLKNGEEFGFKRLVYAYQEKVSGGIADALRLAEEFVGDDDVVVILGDNTTDSDIGESVRLFSEGTNPYRAHLFLKSVNDPERFGVASVVDGKIVSIIEKPKEPLSNFAVTGLYLYSKEVFDFIKELKPSGRGELEITDINNKFLEKGRVSWSMLEGFWRDCGSFDGLLEAGNYWKEKILKEK